MAAPSPDGTRVALLQVDADAANGDIWVWSNVQRTLTRLTFEPGLEVRPVWSPDSTRVAYGRQDGLFVQRADGVGAVERLLEGAAPPYSWSASGEIFHTVGNDVGVVSTDGGAAARTLLATPFNEQEPALSPDGRWLAYASDESGRFEVYVRPYPDVEAGRWQVSTNGGREPKWSADSSALYYLSADAIVAAEVLPGPSFVVGMRRPVLDRSPYLFLQNGPPNYAASPAGDRWLLRKVPSRAGGVNAGHRFIIVQNWTEELKRRVPVD
jgi:dipeptidyl aminopeptidase/acylaminoacyl peptidase